LLISSSIFAQVKTTTKKATLNPIKNKATINKKTMLIRELNTPAYSVGDFIHGGIVFYVDETGEHGLVCAKTDQSTGVRWWAGTDIETRANGEGLYQGMNNTDAIMHYQRNGDGGTYAARICLGIEITEGDMTYKGDITYSDWYLPSKDELHLMYQNKTKINTTATANGGSALANWYYWSSTEKGPAVQGFVVWAEFFRDGNQNGYYKDATYYVRAIRRF
ncbi:MAG: DUF1566 domain-containing protein, partial [Bacteroidetes bacterium]|nr:DUF1566 domain-containing protein [Bacteroidota bacterium]